MHRLFLTAGMVGFLSACIAEKIGREKTRKFCAVAGVTGIISILVGAVMWVSHK